jgi:uncharacterized membrane protein YbhN (UPF0104 family)
MKGADVNHSRTTLRRVVRIVGGVALVALAVVAARAVSWRPVLALAAHLPLPALALSVLASIAQAVVQATRLWALFPRGRRPTWTRAARAHGFGQLTNAFLPARVGDVMKVVAMKNADNATDATGAVLADRALDAVALVLLVLVLAPALLVGVFVAALRLGWAAGGIALALLAGLELLRRARPAVFTKLRRGAAATWHSLRGLTASPRLAVGLALGCIGWVAEAVSTMLLAHPLGVPLSLSQAIGGIMVLNLGTALPVSVANVGSYEAAMAVGLRAFGASLAQGIAIGVLHHAVQLATIAAFALLFWVHDRLTARRARVVAALPTTVATRA